MRKGMKKTAVSLLFVVSTFLFLALFQDKLVPLALKQFIHNRTPGVRLEEFSYDKCNWHRDSVELSGVHFNLTAPGLEGSVKAESCALFFTGKKSTKVYFSIAKPQIAITLDPELEDDPEDAYSMLSKMFFPALPIEIQEGRAQCFLGEKEYSFDFSMPLGKKKELRIAHLGHGKDTHEHGLKKPRSHLRVMMYKPKKEVRQLAVDVEMTSFDLCFFKEVISSSLAGKGLSDIDISGWLEGEVKVNLFQAARPEVRGIDLTLHEVGVKHPAQGSLAYIKKGKIGMWGLKKRFDLEEQSVLSMVPGLEFLSEYRTLNLDIEGGYLGFITGPGGKSIAFKDVQVRTDYQNGYLNHHHLKANFECNESQRPLLILGSESKNKSNFYRQSIEEESSIKRWQFLFSCLHKGSERSLDYALEVPEASHEELDALMKLKQILFGGSEINVDTHALKAYIRGELSDRHHHLRVHYLDAENVNVTKDLTNFSAKSLGLRCNVDLKKKQFYRHSSWDLNIADGAFKQGRRFVEGIHFQGGMNDTYVKPSKLSFYWLDKKTDCLFEGLLSHLNADIETSFLPLEIKRFLSSSICLESKQPSAAQHVKTHLSFGLDASFSQIRTEGVCKLTVGDSKPEEIEFGLNFDSDKNSTITSMLPQYSFLMGWFRAEDLSADALNLAFYLMNKEWQCEGMATVEGSLNRKLVQINIDPTNLAFIAEMAKLYPQKNKGKAPRLNFVFDYQIGKWSASAPLDQYRFEIPAFNLALSSFSSKLNLDGKMFTFKDMKGVCEGIDFTGEMVIDFYQAEQAKVHIRCDKAAGRVKNLERFLNHFNGFENVKLPGEGRVELGEAGHVEMAALVGKEEKLLDLKLSAELKQYNLPISATCHLEDFGAKLTYYLDQGEVVVFDGEGSVIGEQILARRKQWRAKLNKLTFDTQKSQGICQWKLSSPTYDLIVFDSQFEREKEGFLVRCNEEISRFFGSKVDTLSVHIGSDLMLNSLETVGQMSGLSLYGLLELASMMDLAPISSKLLTSIQSPQFSGMLNYNMTISHGFNNANLQVKGKDIRVGKVSIPKVNIAITKRESRVHVADFEVGDFSMRLEGEFKNRRLMTSSLDCSFKENFFHVAEGSFIEEGRISFKNSFFTFNSLASSFPFLSAYPVLDQIGKIKGDGNLEIVFAQDMDSIRCFGKMGLSLIDCFEEGIFVDWIKPFSFEFDTLGRFSVSDAQCHMKTSRDSAIWVRAKLKEGRFDLKGSSNSDNYLKQLSLVVPPEAMLFFAQKGLLSFLKTSGEELSVSGMDFLWENQIDTTADISFGKKLEVSATIKEGYYWFNKESWFIDGAKFSIDGQTMCGSLGVQRDAIDWKVRFKADWEKELFGSVEVAQAGSEESYPLTVAISSSESEGVFIQSVEGEVFGLSMSFRHNPRESVMDRMVLTGGVRINGYALSDYVPQNIADVIERFEIGRGYELSGDLVLYKTPSTFKDSYFSGFFKGKHMEFYGSEVETLMSEVVISPHMVEFSNCCISDAAGLFEIPEIRIEKTPQERWKVLMSKLYIQDFRPSLVKTIGVYRGKIKPLVIRDFTIEDVEGFIDDPLSFKGTGHFSFINTFKRDAHILDIPLDILGRLGLDMGLLVPVKGTVDFLLESGIVHFLDLKNSKSYGDRSDFFFSKKEMSYIDFDGNIDVHIKMKQHVLLKITQPFTLSIVGHVKQPKYLLH